MFKIIGRTFSAISNMFESNPNAIIDVAKGVGTWIDNSKFTEQEQSAANLKLLDRHLEWIAATQGMNLARRYLAILFALNFLISFQICLIAAVIGFISGRKVVDLIDAVVAIVGAFQIGWAMITIIVFYFGKGITEGVKNKLLDRK